MQHTRSLGILAIVMQVLMVPVAAFAPVWASEKLGEIGTVLAIKGRPTLSAGSGKPSRLTVLGALHEGDNLLLIAQEYVRFCNERAGKLVEIAGPGLVKLTDAGVVKSDGTPLITTSGRCEASPTADSNGGVILRGLKPRPAH